MDSSTEGKFRLLNAGKEDTLSGVEPLEAPGEDTNWTRWSFSMRTHFKRVKLMYLIDPVGFSPAAGAVRKDDEMRLCDLINRYAGKSNFALIVDFEDNPEGMWNALLAAHSVSTLGTRMYWLNRLIRGRPEDDDISKHIDTQLNCLMRLKSLITKEAPLNPDELFVTAMLNSLPSDWSAVVAPLEQRDSCSLEVVIRTLRNKIMKRSASDDVVEVSSTTVKKNRHRRGKKKAEIATSSQGTATEASATDQVCNHCKKPGHYMASCNTLQKDLDELRNLRNPKAAKSQSAAASTVVENEKYVVFESDDESNIAEVNSAEGTGRSKWALDSACTACMSPHVDVHSKVIRESVVTNVRLADKSVIKSNKSFEKDFGITNLERVPVIHLPTLNRPLLSTSQICKLGFTVHHDAKQALIKDSSGAVVGVAKERDGLYLLDEQEPVRHSTSSVSHMSALTLSDWHERLDHLNSRSLSYLLKQKGIVVKGGGENPRQCETCFRAKSVKRTFLNRNYHRSQTVLELVHSDVWSCSEKSREGYSMFVSFIDDASKVAYMYPIKKKSDSFTCFKLFLAETERISGKSLVKLRTDNGGEYVSKEFKLFLEDRGIQHDPGPPHSPELNGVAERWNRTICDKIRSALLKSDLSQAFWVDAAKHCVESYNLSPTHTAFGRQCPSDAFLNKQHTINHLRPFGCASWYLIPTVNRGKLDERGRPSMLLYYLKDGNGYMLWDRVSGKTVKSTHVKFREDCFPGPAIVKKDNDEPEALPWPEDDREGVDVVTDREVQEDVDDVHDDGMTVRKSGRLRNQPRRLGNLVAQNTEETRLVDIDPTSWKKMLKSNEARKWIAAADAEYASLIGMETWKLVPRPSKRNIIRNRWIFKTKRRVDGTIEKLKARLVAKGFTQVKGVDFSEVFAPTTRLESVRILLSIMALKNWRGRQIDIKAAFLNGKLNEQLYMEQPEGFIDPVHPDYVCELKGSLYGSKQSPRQWNERLHEVLIKLGLTVSKHDPSLYYQLLDEKLIGMCVVHVDDIGITGKDTFVAHIEKGLSQNFDISLNCDLRDFLSLKISRDFKNRTASINQSHYILELGKLYFPSGHKAVAMPCDSEFKNLQAAQDSDCQTQNPYSSLIGGLLWVARCSRPDVAFAVNRLSQFLRRPTDAHWLAAKRVLAFLLTTADKELTLGGQSILCAFSDADWAEDLNDRKSTTGFVYRLGEGAISWSSKKQTSVALSSTEAEYVAMSETVREGLWLVRLMKELRMYHEGPVKVFVDNEGAEALSKNASHHSRSKHIHNRYHFVRDCVKDGSIAPCHVSTLEMAADALTKPMGKVMNARHMDILGVR